MITMDQANTINSAVREYFRSGYKSDNKFYSSKNGDARSDQKKRRNENVLKANTSIMKQRTSPNMRQITPPNMRQITPPNMRQITPPNMRQITPPNMRQITPPNLSLNMLSYKRAGNCGEYTERAGNCGGYTENAGNCGEYTERAVNFALKMDSVTTVWTFGCRGLVDHIFCVFNLPQAPNNLRTLGDMSSDNPHPDVIVCDPWANIVCSYADYPKRLEEKMKKWGTRGKHIMSGTDSISATDWGRECLKAPADFEQKR
ncbi:hypothetical protein L7G72_13015 [Xenorhabdus bovienii]|uniref:hypothetical protein n=1 Tax=Xenorhabdus bovienii TaxID=40576 RepID=UPI001EDE1A1E|nr:hypothetical protein [Xenorhabdus bovienii]MCG3462756.1 hypothetical protein [Xenorhabdus bovienii]